MQAEAALDAKLRGPHAFSLERLLHIFFFLFSMHAEVCDGGGGTNSAGTFGVEQALR